MKGLTIMKKLNKNTTPRNSLTRQQLRQNRRARRAYGVFVMALAVCAILSSTAFAAGNDPLTIVNNLSDFIFSCIKAVGVIILGWGIVQLGMSVQSHDASQRSQGVLCVFGGLIITFAKEILTAIGAV